ncbi:MAG: hypothetical protein HY344_03980 [Candidatus Levybacteria bacterium]|nr:hypothetical protein [Candidatus Levybacteria bacterium]
MKYYELTKEEQKLLNEVEKGEWIQVPNFEKEKKRFQEIAKNTLNKTKNINIRLSERTLAKLKRKAAEEGIPYQTLASSILHKATA